MQAAFHWPDVFRATVSLHGTHLVNDNPDLAAPFRRKI